MPRIDDQTADRQGVLFWLSAHIGKGLQRRLCDRTLQLVDQSGEVQIQIA